MGGFVEVGQSTRPLVEGAPTIHLRRARDEALRLSQEANAVLNQMLVELSLYVKINKGIYPRSSNLSNPDLLI